MRAITYSRFGPASEVLSLTNLDTPTPAAGEVLVRLAFSGVNPSDAKARAGGRPGVTKPAFDTIIPHSDGSGIIEAVGEGTDLAVGDRVAYCAAGFGAYSEAINLPAARLVTLPDELDLGALVVRNTSLTVIDGPPWHASRVACDDHLDGDLLADGAAA